MNGRERGWPIGGGLLWLAAPVWVVPGTADRARRLKWGGARTHARTRTQSRAHTRKWSAHTHTHKSAAGHATTTRREYLRSSARARVYMRAGRPAAHTFAAPPDRGVTRAP